MPDELKLLYRTRETLAAPVYRARELSVNGPSIPCAGSSWGQGLMEKATSPAVTFVRTCRAENNVGKMRRQVLAPKSWLRILC